MWGPIRGPCRPLFLRAWARVRLPGRHWLRGERAAYCCFLGCPVSSDPWSGGLWGCRQRAGALEGGGETGRNGQAGWTLSALEAGGRAGLWPQEFILPEALEDHRWSEIRGGQGGDSGGVVREATDTSLYSLLESQDPCRVDRLRRAASPGGLAWESRPRDYSATLVRRLGPPRDRQNANELQWNTAVTRSQIAARYDQCLPPGEVNEGICSGPS